MAPESHNDGLRYKKYFVGNVFYNLSFAIAAISVFQNKEAFLSRINQVYYCTLFCTTQAHYDYLQLINLIKLETIYKRLLSLVSLIKRSC